MKDIISLCFATWFLIHSFKNQISIKLSVVLSGASLNLFRSKPRSMWMWENVTRSRVLDVVSEGESAVEQKVSPATCQAPSTRMSHNVTNFCQQYQRWDPSPYWMNAWFYVCPLSFKIYKSKLLRNFFLNLDPWSLNPKFWICKLIQVRE